ncbi:unnamed protein product [Didymodactylos carnosus]|uniref:FAM194 C-terminal domain-containing protein n=1 Tax=Didymodactylos carnosus TaxID=1234261 RepID=A0A813SNV4_9BILA|nr:unnamed protein product [Didymodactylos carnosus]CAF1216616.1 unnamed protein product [Didymodactylos carnosus]CAF3583274.1 unnamed protein product [Didymodactylos carnosus]CAF4025005.1 unnamed protein product [Didymodactylos carnosus]
MRKFETVDLYFTALHEAAVASSLTQLIRCRMSRGAYFFDQNSPHYRSTRRYKRHPDELQRALQEAKLIDETQIPTSATSVTAGETEEKLKSSSTSNILTQIQRELFHKTNTTIVPDVLISELEDIIQRIEDENKIYAEADNEEEEQLQERQSLPGQVIMMLHANWNDLTEDADYKFKTWRTKYAEDQWRKYVERKRQEQQRQGIGGKKQLHNRQSVGSSRSNISHTRMSQLKVGLSRTQRALSRISFFSSNDDLTARTKLKQIQGSQDSLDNQKKDALSVEFKLSKVTNEIATQTPKGISFDVTKPITDSQDDAIVAIRKKGRKILSDSIARIHATAGDPTTRQAPRIFFYGDHPQLRSKSTLLNFNDQARRQKSKFILSILRHEIPEPYSCDIEIPTNKKKYYLELADGTIQLYYPSGHLAMQRIPVSNHPSSYSTLLYDDNDIQFEQFLGIITSQGSVVIMQPGLHARFISNDDRGLLCNGKTGLAERQMRWHSDQNYPRTQSVLSTSQDYMSPHQNDELPPENDVQLQLNSYMQLEYTSPYDIRFAFGCNREEYKFQFGCIQKDTSNIGQAITKLNESMNLQKSISKKKINSTNKIIQSSSNTVASSQHGSQDGDGKSGNIDQTTKQIQIERLLDGNINLKELPYTKELLHLRKKIRNICDSWLKEYRTALGTSN